VELSSCVAQPKPPLFPHASRSLKLCCCLRARAGPELSYGRWMDSSFREEGVREKGNKGKTMGRNPRELLVTRTGLSERAEDAHALHARESRGEKLWRCRSIDAQCNSSRER
jgi:hypothetical protein